MRSAAFVFTMMLFVLCCAPTRDAAYFTQLGIDKMRTKLEAPGTEGSYATDAANCLEKAIALDSTHGPAYAYLMFPYYTQSELGEIDRGTAMAKSRLAFARAQELAPDHPATIIAAAFIKKNYDDDPAAAMTLLQRAIELYPDNSETHRELGWSYLIEAKLDLALEQAELAIKADPDSKQAYFLLGLVHQQLENYEQALAAFREKLSEDTNNMYERIHIAYINLLIGHFDQAEEVARQNLKDHPNDAQVKDRLAYALALNGKYDEALALYTETNQRIAISWVNGLLGNEEKAHQGIIELQQSEESRTCGAIGAIYTGLGEFDKAIEAFEKALKSAQEHSNERDLHDIGRWLATEPWFRPVQEDPRMQAIIAQTGYQVNSNDGR